MPEPSQLPIAEHLAERGVLRRAIEQGEPVYRASAEFEAKALRLAEYQASAAEQARLN